jgi:hypothetical protein
VEYDDETARTIKLFYVDVWRLLESRARIDAKAIDGVPEDIRDPAVPLVGPRTFAVRFFRKRRF